MTWLDSITDSVDMGLSKLWEIVGDRGAWRAAARGVTESRTLNNKNDAAMLKRQKVSTQGDRHPRSLGV